MLQELTFSASTLVDKGVCTSVKEVFDPIPGRSSLISSSGEDTCIFQVRTFLVGDGVPSQLDHDHPLLSKSGFTSNTDLALIE